MDLFLIIRDFRAQLDKYLKIFMELINKLKWINKCREINSKFQDAKALIKLNLIQAYNVKNNRNINFKKVNSKIFNLKVLKMKN